MFCSGSKWSIFAPQFICINPNAVSYTHLDVYKRQAQDTANTLNHREAGDPTVKVQLDNTHALAQEIKAEVFNARDHAEKAKEAAEKSASKAEEAITLTNKFTKEIKSEVEELKIFSKKTQGMIDILFGHLGIMGKRKDDPTPGTVSYTHLEAKKIIFNFFVDYLPCFTNVVR